MYSKPLLKFTLASDMYQILIAHVAAGPVIVCYMFFSSVVDRSNELFNCRIIYIALKSTKLCFGKQHRQRAVNTIFPHFVYKFCFPIVKSRK